MHGLLKASDGINATLALVGRIAGWLFLANMIVICFDVITRRIGYQLPDMGSTRLQELEWLFEGARRHSDDQFMVMPQLENADLLGGHWDLLFSHPVYYVEERAPGAPTTSWPLSRPRTCRSPSPTRAPRAPRGIRTR